MNKLTVSFLNVAISGLLLTASAFKILSFQSTWGDLSYVVNELNRGLDYYQEFGCVIGNGFYEYRGHNPTHNTKPNWTPRHKPNNKTSYSIKNHTYKSSEEASYQVKTYTVDGKAYYAMSCSNDIKREDYPPNYTCKTKQLRFNGYEYNPYSYFTTASVFIWCVTAKIINIVYTIFAVFVFLSLEFQYFETFYTKNLSLLMSLPGRSLSYFLIGFLSFEVDFIGILIPSIITSVGALMVLLSFVYPGYKISGCIPYIFKSIQLDTQVYEQLPNYEEKVAQI